MQARKLETSANQHLKMSKAPDLRHGLHRHGAGRRLHSLGKLLFTSLTTHNATCGFSPEDPGKVGTWPIPSFSFVPFSAKVTVVEKNV